MEAGENSQAWQGILQPNSGETYPQDLVDMILYLIIYFINVIYIYIYICMYIYIDRIWYAVHCMYVVCNSLYIYIYTHNIAGTRTYLPLFDMIL